jgi:hypothetical protein
MKTRKYWGTILAVIGLLLAAWAIYATYDVYSKSKPQKHLQLSLVAAIPLIDIRPEAAGDITILYKNQPVDNAILLQIRLENSGNQPILPADYVKPVTFSFASAGEIADASITDLEPSNMGLVISRTSKYQAELAPILLNPSDSANIRFAILADGSETVVNNLQIDGRIVGVKEVKLTLPSGEEPNPIIAVVISVISGGIAGVLLVALFFKILGNGVLHIELSRRRKRELPEKC